jgi:very-short-patch-repair endonuclease
MTEVFNRPSQRSFRQDLRNDMPDAEIILWSRLKQGQVFGCKFRRQFGIAGFVVDFYCPKLRLAIEVDGDTHFVGDAPQKDIARQKQIEEYDVKFLRVTNNDVYKNLGGVLKTIEHTVMELGKGRA